MPLHKAPYWKGQYDNIELPVTDEVSDTLLRLPMYYGMERIDVVFVVGKVRDFYKEEIRC